MAMIIVVYLFSIILMMIISGEIGKRTKKIFPTNAQNPNSGAPTK